MTNPPVASPVRRRARLRSAASVLDVIHLREQHAQRIVCRPLILRDPIVLGVVVVTLVETAGAVELVEAFGPASGAAQIEAVARHARVRLSERDEGLPRVTQ